VLIQGVRERLQELARNMIIHVLTADTFGRADQELKGLPLEITILKSSAEDRSKEEYVNALGPDQVVAMGNGSNDALMLHKAGLGVAVMEEEGCSVQALLNADMVVKSITEGLDLLAKPLRIKAGLRR
jgi:soluble P-type ATPase